MELWLCFLCSPGPQRHLVFLKRCFPPSPGIVPRVLDLPCGTHSCYGPLRSARLQCSAPLFNYRLGESQWICQELLQGNVSVTNSAVIQSLFFSVRRKNCPRAKPPRYYPQAISVVFWFGKEKQSLSATLAAKLKQPKHFLEACLLSHSN